jgi:hypothetical protein
VAGGPGDLLQGRADRLGDQFHAGQVPQGGKDMGGVGALGGALADSPASFPPGPGQVKEPVGPPVLQQPVAEATQHAVVEAGIVEPEAERVLEVDRRRTASAASRPDRPSRNRSTLTGAS